MRRSVSSPMTDATSSVRSLNEISQPMGVPNEFVVEFFTPSLDSYELFHNIDIDEEEEADDADEPSQSAPPPINLDQENADTTA